MHKVKSVIALHSTDIMRDCTEGKLYQVHTCTPKNSHCPDGTLAYCDAYTFRDDIGDNVTVWLDGTDVEVYE